MAFEDCGLKARSWHLSLFLKVSVHCYQQNTETPTTSKEGASPFCKPVHTTAEGQHAQSAFSFSQQNMFIISIFSQQDTLEKAVCPPSLGSDPSFLQLPYSPLCPTVHNLSPRELRTPAELGALPPYHPQRWQG